MKVVVGMLLCAASLVAGCSSVEGDAQPVDASVNEPDFDPCEAIPDVAIRGVGMDPATEERDIMGVHQPGWKMCSWNNRRDTVTASVSSLTLEDIRRDDSFRDFLNIELGERPGVSFGVVADSKGIGCNVATEVGGVLFMVASTVLNKAESDPCSLARDAAAILLPYVA